MTKNTKLALTVGSVALAGLIVMPKLLKSQSTTTTYPGGNYNPGGYPQTYPPQNNQNSNGGLFSWIDDIFGGGGTTPNPGGNEPPYVYTPKTGYGFDTRCFSTHPNLNVKPWQVMAKVWETLEDVPANIPHECLITKTVNV